MPGEEVYVQKLGDAVILTPTEDPWAPLRMSLTMFTDDFMADRAQPEVQVREDACGDSCSIPVRAQPELLAPTKPTRLIGATRGQKMRGAGPPDEEAE